MTDLKGTLAEISQEQSQSTALTVIDSQSLEVQTVPKISIDDRELQYTLAQLSRVVKLSKLSPKQKIYFTATNNNVKIFVYGARFNVCRSIKAHGTCHDVNFALTFKAAAMIEKSLKQLIYNNKFTTTTFEYAKDVATVRFARGLSFDFATLWGMDGFVDDTLDALSSTIVLAQNELKTLLNSTLYAVNDKGFSHPIFNTVNIKFADGSLTLTATDGNQLATATTDKVCGDEFTCNIFGDALKFILPLLNGDDDVTITTTEHRSKFAFGEWLIVACNYTDAKFPDCSNILSEDTPVTAVIENSGWGTGREHLIETIKLIAQVADENGAIELIFSQGDLTIQSAREKIGSARRSLEALTFGVEHGTARGKFNAKYLLNMLSHAEDTNVEFSLSEKAISIRTDNTTAVSLALKNSVELPKSKLVLANVA